jgi:hypothetical protein
VRNMAPARRRVKSKLCEQTKYRLRFILKSIQIAA